MHEVMVPLDKAAEGEEELLLDVCKRCHLVWFDPREYGDLASLVPPPVAKLQQETQRVLTKIDMTRIKRRVEADRSIAEPLPGWKVLLSLFVPIELDNPLRNIPWTTYALMVVLFAVGTISIVRLPESAYNWGLISDQWDRMGGLTLFTAFFVHGSVWHLVVNLYFLWVFGDNIEDYLGPGRFLLLLAICTVAGGVAHLMFHPAASIPTIGASGGVSGVIVFYALRFPRTRLAFRSVVLMGLQFKFSAIGGLLFWLVGQAGLTYLVLHEVTLVDTFAHLGGASAGFTLWLVWRRQDVLLPGGVERDFV
jgi:membrane associated rhomboid family serine protease